MKKLINDPDDVVEESVAGFVGAHPDILALRRDPLVVTRAGGTVRGKVGLVSGGGSGHEPLHIGYVGHGMLDAAVPGRLFTSPPPEPIAVATRAADGGAGVLHVVKNYTGDVLNFEVAAELAAAEGVKVRSVLVADDVAVDGSTFTAGRRGVAGTVLVEKIAGAAAELGADLPGVEALARRVAGSVRSMGVALAAPTLPRAGRPSFDLGADEVELGVGIHGEPGRARVPLGGADELTDQLLDPVVADLGLAAGQDVLLFVNGLGATPAAELAIVHARARARLEGMGVRVARSLLGSYVTSLDMAGASVSVLRLDDEMVRLWDAPVCTAALRWGR